MDSPQEVSWYNMAIVKLVFLGDQVTEMAVQPCFETTFHALGATGLSKERS